MDALRLGRKGREGLVMLALLAAGPLVGGCFGLFDPATPQAPVNGGSTIVTDYSSPGGSLLTMSAGMDAKALGKDAYVGAFADSLIDGVAFRATFDPEVAARLGGPIPTWNLELERFFYSGFVALRSDPYRMRWTEYDTAPEDDVNYDTGNAIYYRRYEVYTVTNDGTTTGRIAIGLADLTFKRVTSTRWVIVDWDDHVDPAVGVDPSNPDDLSMSALRLRTRITN